MVVPPVSNWRFKCKVCGAEQSGYRDEQLSQTSSKCKICGGEMNGAPIIHRGPFPENPLKRY
jgi:transcription elongation factor Elf1